MRPDAPGISRSPRPAVVGKDVVQTGGLAFDVPRVVDDHEDVRLGAERDLRSNSCGRALLENVDDLVC